MKNFLKNSICLCVLMVAFCYQVANAQKVVTNVSTGDVQACKAYLAEHPLDIIVNRFAEPKKLGNDSDSLFLGMTVFLRNDSLIYRRDILKISKRTKLDPKKQAILDSLSVEANFLKEVTNHGQRRDEQGYEYIRQDGSKGYIPFRLTNKEGFYLTFGGGFSFTKGYSGVVALAGFGYTGTWLYAEVSAGPAHSRYSDYAEAENAGDTYLAISARGEIGIQPFHWRYDTDRIFFLAGLRFESFFTDSKVGVKSKGNTLTPVFGIKYEHRFRNHGWSLWAKATMEEHKDVLQNIENKWRWGPSFQMGVKTYLWKDKVRKNPSLQD